MGKMLLRFFANDEGNSPLRVIFSVADFRWRACGFALEFVAWLESRCGVEVFEGVARGGFAVRWIEKEIRGLSDVGLAFFRKR